MVFEPKSGKIGIIGGSFDPVHLGHLVIAQDALERLELDEVIFIPAFVAPHKQHLRQAGGEHRLNMLRLATDGDPRFFVSDIEQLRGGVSYTLDTVCELKGEYPDSDLFLIIGSDTLVELHTWYKIDELLELCEVATFMRPEESSYAGIAEKIGLAEEQRERLLGNLIEAHLIEISSTEIRTRIAAGRGIRYLVPPAVEKYIYEHGLYRG